MNINVIKIVPEDWSIKDREDKIEVNYQLKRGNHNRKTFAFPKEIEIDERFMECIGLYLGDGDLNRKEKTHLGFCSKDKDIANHVWCFLQDYFFINSNDVTFSVQYNKENPKIKTEWSSCFGISENKINTRYSERHNYEACRIQVNGVVFTKLFALILQKVLSGNFMQDSSLRRGLLRGLFAAEGNIGIDYLEKKPYISQITFSLHLKEKNISNIIVSILAQERVSYQIKVIASHKTREIVIYNWKNYHKLWAMRLFDICGRKQEGFYRVLKNLRVFCDLKPLYREKLFQKQGLKQKEIASLIGSWQGNVSKMITGELWLNMDALYLLSRRTTHENSVPQIKEIVIGSLTKIKNNPLNREFINYLYSLREDSFNQ